MPFMHERFPIRWVLAATLLVAWSGSLHAQAYVPDPHPDWESRAPAEVDLDPGALSVAVDFAIVSETDAPRDLELAHYLSGFRREPCSEAIGPFTTRGEPTGVIVKDGWIVAEWGEPDRVDMTFSVTKSFLPPDSLFAGEHNAAITWNHLLRQTSDWEGTCGASPTGRTGREGSPKPGSSNWFLNTDRELLPSAPESAFAHLGGGTNAVVGLPEQDMVVVARWIRRDALDGLVQRVLAAVEV